MAAGKFHTRAAQKPDVYLRMGRINNIHPHPAAPATQLAPTLLDPRFEHESCGVGFVATLSGHPTHRILEQALEALARLAHRGAIAADRVSSDGVGIKTAIPRQLLLDSCGLHLAADRPLGVGVVFFPQDAPES